MNLFGLVFPIFKCSSTVPRTPILEYGTASYLGEGVYITAGHSLIPPDDGGKLAVALPLVQSSPTTLSCMLRLVSAVERREEWDIGLFRISPLMQEEHPMVMAPNWYLADEPYCNLFADVCAPGFPHGLNTMPDYNVHTSRVHKGNIVGIAPFHLHNGKGFRSYELSFTVPIGLSGAPVMTAQWPTRVVGIAIGMKETAVNLTVTKELEDDGKRLEVYTTAQIQHYGVAVPSTVIGNISSSLLGMTVRDFVKKQGHDDSGYR